MKIGFLFPGYGVQHVGMIKDLHAQIRIVQEYFEEADNCLDTNFEKLLFASSEHELSKMANAYPVLFLVGVAVAAALNEKGIEPSFVAGYDIGAYAALWTAHALTFPDGLYLINKYVTLYQDALEKLPSLAIAQIRGLSRQKVEKLCAHLTEGDDQLSIAASLSPEIHSVGGPSGLIDTLKEVSEKEEFSLAELPLEYGLHSPVLKPVVEHFKMSLNKVDVREPAVPIVDVLNGKKIKNSNAIQEMIVHLIDSPVRWDLAIQKFTDCEVVVLCGTSKEWTTSIQTMLPAVNVVPITTLSDIEELHTYLQKNSK